MNLNKRNRIVTGLGTFERALETAVHIYFVNFAETDDNFKTKMFDRRMNLITSDATGDMNEMIETGAFKWMSEKMKINLVITI